MSKLTVEFPESLQRSIAAFAAKEGYSIDQFLASAAAEKMAALRTVDFLRQEAAQGHRVDFDRFLDSVPDKTLPETDPVNQNDGLE